MSAYLPPLRPPGVERSISPRRQRAWAWEGLPGSLGRSQAGSQAQILGQERLQADQTCLAGLWTLEPSMANVSTLTQGYKHHTFFLTRKLESWWNGNTCSNQPMSYRWATRYIEEMICPMSRSQFAVERNEKSSPCFLTHFGYKTWWWVENRKFPPPWKKPKWITQ